jgi:hypothetical protein
MDDTGIGDAGLAHLKKLTKLRSIVAQGTTITDAGLEHLTELTALEYVGAYRTKVTKEGAEKLKKTLTKVQVSYGGD